MALLFLLIYMVPSKYQKEIYKFIKEETGNLVVRAAAGSGKTTTLLHCASLIPENNSLVFLAFNNTIVNELKSKVDRKNSQVTTMHSLCWRALIKHYKFKAELKPSKPLQYIKTVLNKSKINPKKFGYYQHLFTNILSLIRQSLSFDIESVLKIAEKHSFLISEDEAKMALEILDKMDKNNKEFDFTDMIYRCVKDEVELPKFDYVFVDESQDLSVLQQEILKKVRTRNSRMIAVGDPNQAIYGFAGADSDSYNRLKDLFSNTKELPLSVNYRCGSRIIMEARKLTKDIMPFQDASKGEVIIDAFIDDVKPEDWIVCRNVKPLIISNLYLLSRGIKSFVKGKDIGVGLISLINKFKSSNVKDVIRKFEENITTESEKLIKKGVRNPLNVEKIDSMVQKLDILKVLSYNITLTSQLTEKINNIFKENGEGVMLTTIHKSKGLENKNVYILYPELIPSKFAEQDWELQQESNLMYVAITRAKHRLGYISDYDKIITETKKILENKRK